MHTLSTMLMVLGIFALVGSAIRGVQAGDCYSRNDAHRMSLMAWGLFFLSAVLFTVSVGTY